MIAWAPPLPIAEVGGHPLAFVRAAAKLGVLVFLLAAAIGAPGARAVEAINVPTKGPPIDLTGAVEIQHSDGDRVQISTAPGPDGIVRRIEIRAREPEEVRSSAVTLERRSGSADPYPPP